MTATGSRSTAPAPAHSAAPARPASPDRTYAASVAAELSDPHKFTARFLHPGKYPVVQRAGVSPEGAFGLAAAMAGTTPAELERYQREFAAEVQASAALLAPDAASRLPFAPGDVVVVLGDSITDDSLSWAYQLEAYLERHRPELGIRVRNAGITAHTTQQAIARIDRLVALEPDWVIQLLGTNDARRHGGGALKVAMQSLDETRRNLAHLAELVAAETGATLVSMTPTPVIEADAEAWEPFRGERITWREADVAAVAEAVRQQSAASRSASLVVDLHEAFALAWARDPEPLAPLLLPDGVHPTVAGQRLILETLLQALTRSPELDDELRLEGELTHDDRTSPATT